MEGFLIVTLVFLGITVFANLLVCLALGRSNETDLGSFAVALLNLFPLILAIVAISLCL